MRLIILVDAAQDIKGLSHLKSDSQFKMYKSNTSVGRQDYSHPVERIC